MSGASSATTTINARTPPANPACRTTCRVQCVLVPIDSAATDPRVHNCVQQVGQKAPKRYRSRGNDHAGGDEWIVSCAHSIEDHPTHPWPREHTFDEHGACEQDGQRKPEQTDGGDQRIAEYMYQHDASLTYTLGASGPHKIIGQYSKQLRSLVSCHRRARQKRQRN